MALDSWSSRLEI
jgi:hypothetical protein